MLLVEAKALDTAEGTECAVAAALLDTTAASFSVPAPAAELAACPRDIHRTPRSL